MTTNGSTTWKESYNIINFGITGFKGWMSDFGLLLFIVVLFGLMIILRIKAAISVGLLVQNVRKILTIVNISALILICTNESPPFNKRWPVPLAMVEILPCTISNAWTSGNAMASDTVLEPNDFIYFGIKILSFMSSFRKLKNDEYDAENMELEVLLKED